jgi:hypothetical protein
LLQIRVRIVEPWLPTLLFVTTGRGVPGRRTTGTNPTLGARRPFVVPAKAGIQGGEYRTRPWTPASAGATVVDGSSFLLDVPQKDDRRDDDAVEVLAVGGRHDELAGRHIRDFVAIGLYLDVRAESLLR